MAWINFKGSLRVRGGGGGGGRGKFVVAVGQNRRALRSINKKVVEAPVPYVVLKEGLTE